MRDMRFKAAHRGGPLELRRHRLLALWAADCAEHVLPLFEAQHPQDDRPRRAIETARVWARGEVSVGVARAASVAAHAAARAAADAAAQAAARAAGHAVATAHMADHAPGAAAYALKAVRTSGGAPDGSAVAERERAWQHARLPEEIRDLVLTGGTRRPALK